MSSPTPSTPLVQQEPSFHPAPTGGVSAGPAPCRGADSVATINTYTANGRRDTVKKAKLFRTGGSQAVRLPAEFRFPGDEVEIRRDSETGDVVLSPVASGWSEWKEFFARLEELDVPGDFLVERDQPPAQERDGLS